MLCPEWTNVKFRKNYQRRQFQEIWKSQPGQPIVTYHFKNNIRMLFVNKKYLLYNGKG